MAKILIEKAVRGIDLLDYIQICCEYEDWCNTHCDISEWSWVCVKGAEAFWSETRRSHIKFRKASDATAFRLRFGL